MPKVRPQDMELPAGLLDDFDGRITDTRFAVKEDYAAVSATSDPMLILTIETAELEQPIEQGYSIGATRQWEVVRGGAEVVSRVKPDSHAWIAGSRAGDLVAAMMETIGNGDRKAGQAVLLKRDRWMTEAEFYIGYNFHWKRVGKMSVDGKERQVLLPVAFLGEESAATAPSAPPAYLEVLKSLAAGKTEGDLKKAILARPELKKNAELMGEVFNRGLLTRLEESGELVKDPSTGKYL